ncbi:SHOCT domain-containing protein [Mycobacterium sp. THU-M104]
MAEIAAGLRELGELRESHLLTDEEFTTLKQRLLGF